MSAPGMKQGRVGRGRRNPSRGWGNPEGGTYRRLVSSGFCGFPLLKCAVEGETPGEPVGRPGASQAHPAAVGRLSSEEEPKFTRGLQLQFTVSAASLGGIASGPSNGAGVARKPIAGYRSGGRL